MCMHALRRYDATKLGSTKETKFSYQNYPQVGRLPAVLALCGAIYVDLYGLLHMRTTDTTRKADLQ